MQYQNTPRYLAAEPIVRQLAALAVDLTQRGDDDGDLYAVASDLLPALADRLTGEGSDAATELLAANIWPELSPDASSAEKAFQIGGAYLLAERPGRTVAQLAAARFLQAAALAAVAILAQEAPDALPPIPDHGAGCADLVSAMTCPAMERAA